MIRYFSTTVYSASTIVFVEFLLTDFSRCINRRHQSLKTTTEVSVIAMAKKNKLIKKLVMRNKPVIRNNMLFFIN